jgi:hypothetical protein
MDVGGHSRMPFEEDIDRANLSLSIAIRAETRTARRRYAQRQLKPNNGT